VRKTVAVVQSNYIPWKGYFDLINKVDEFILFDDMQYTQRDWRNRNKIKTKEGLMWLSIPVNRKGKYFQKINEVTISEPTWNIRHWKSIAHNYSGAKYFKEYKELFKDLYLCSTETYLSQINYQFIRAICGILGIQTKISWSMDYCLIEGKTERLIHLCRQAGATVYLSGPMAKNYLDEALFQEAGITLHYMDYTGYPEYKQLFPPFQHGVSILDLIFNTGPHASRYMLSF
jgi:hypothetical protein